MVKPYKNSIPTHAYCDLRMITHPCTKFGEDRPKNGFSRAIYNFGAARGRAGFTHACCDLRLIIHLNLVKIGRKWFL